MAFEDHRTARVATRLAFFVAGFGMACWAPLVPLAKARLGVDDATLGLLLLCIGAGSLTAMAATGPLIARYGSRPVILAGGAGLALVLPVLTVVTAPIALGAGLLMFGASLGALDVAVNVHGVDVERKSQRPVLSGFHALFSVGGFAGSGAMTVLLSAGVGAFAGGLLCTAIMLILLLAARPGLLRDRGAADGPSFVRPRGIVLLLAALAAITFLAEGAILDWSALLVTQTGLAAPAEGGLAYILFSLAMTVARLTGDRVTASLGDRTTVLAGGLVMIAGFVAVLTVPIPALAMSGFVLIGLGAANIVPLLFRAAGAQRDMPPELAIAAVTTVGYAGILAGPAGIGFVADALGLKTAFWLLAALLLVVPLSARRIGVAKG